MRYTLTLGGELTDGLRQVLLHIVFILVALSVARSMFKMETVSAHSPAGGGPATVDKLAGFS